MHLQASSQEFCCDSRTFCKLKIAKMQGCHGRGEAGATIPLLRCTVLYYAGEGIILLSVCRDHFPKRICQVFIHLCTEYEVKGGWQMRKYCQKTCGVCKFFERKFMNIYLEDLKREIEVVNRIQSN